MYSLRISWPVFLARVGKKNWYRSTVPLTCTAALHVHQRCVIPTNYTHDARKLHMQNRQIHVVKIHAINFRMCVNYRR